MSKVRIATILGAAAIAATLAAAALGAFTATTANPAGSFTAKKVFPGTRTTSAWTIWDNSNGGSGTTATDSKSYVDGVVATTGTFSSSWSASRYVEFDFQNPSPAGLAVTAATFRLDFSRNSSGTLCFYFEVRRISTGAVLATHGSSGSPVACNSTGTIQSSSTSIPSVTTTEIANDLRIRIFGQSSGSQGMRIDRATVSATTPYATRTLYQIRYVDASTGTATTTLWPLHAAEGTTLTHASNWATSYASGRWLRFTFPTSHVPTGATVTGATLHHTYRSAAATTSCWYFEVYSGATLLATHGSTSSNVSCATATATTDAVPLPSVDTVAEANSVVVKAFFKSSPTGKTLHDHVALGIDWYLDDDNGGGTPVCSAPGSQTLVSNTDSWTDQASPSANNGVDSNLFVLSKSGSQNRRSLVTFSLPGLPEGCSVTAATLRVFNNSAVTGRTIDAYRAGGGWTETGVTWTNQPAVAGTAVSLASASGWMQWAVTTHVQAIYSSGTNNGFILRDSVEDSAASPSQNFLSSDAGSSSPELVLTFG